MKTKLLFWILFVTTLLSCTSKDKTVSEAEKGIIKKEVKKIVNMFIVGCEQTDFSLVMKTMNYSPEFRYKVQGRLTAICQNRTNSRENNKVSVQRRCQLIMKAYL